MSVEFCEDECNCADFGCTAGPGEHDDGFGCTNQDCGCIAGWRFGEPS